MQRARFKEGFGILKTVGQPQWLPSRWRRSGIASLWAAIFTSGQNTEYNFRSSGHTKLEQQFILCG